MSASFGDSHDLDRLETDTVYRIYRKIYLHTLTSAVASNLSFFSSFFSVSLFSLLSLAAEQKIRQCIIIQFVKTER